MREGGGEGEKLWANPGESNKTTKHEGQLRTIRRWQKSERGAVREEAAAGGCRCKGRSRSRGMPLPLRTPPPCACHHLNCNQGKLTLVSDLRTVSQPFQVFFKHQDCEMRQQQLETQTPFVTMSSLLTLRCSVHDVTIIWRRSQKACRHVLRKHHHPLAMEGELLKNNF